jgi:UDP-glucose 4-epimerase
MAGRPTLPVPHPLFGPTFTQLSRRIGAGAVHADGVQLLRYGRGVDNTRMRSELGYEPRFDAVEAVRDFVSKTSASRRLIASPLPAAVGERIAR